MNFANKEIYGKKTNFFFFWVKGEEIQNVISHKQ